jgi:hypothetical protein
MHHALAQPAVADLKRKSVVGGVAAVSAQAVRFVVQTATTTVLAGGSRGPAVRLEKREVDYDPECFDQGALRDLPLRRLVRTWLQRYAHSH